MYQPMGIQKNNFDCLATPNLFLFASSSMPLSVNRSYSPVRTSKNDSGQSIRHMIMNGESKGWKEWMQIAVSVSLRSNHLSPFSKAKPHFDEPCACTVFFVMKKISDIDNRLKLLYDSLEGVVYPKDSRIFVQHTYKVPCASSSGFVIMVAPERMNREMCRTVESFYYDENGKEFLADAFSRDAIAEISLRISNTNGFDEFLPEGNLNALERI